MDVKDLITKLPMQELIWTARTSEMEFLDFIVQEHKPKTIVEIGTHLGGTTVVLNNAAPDAILHTYDINAIDPKSGKPAGGSTEHLCNKNVVYHRGGTSCDVDFKHDMCFIDADHRSPEVFVDAMNCIRFAEFPYMFATHDVGFEEDPMYHPNSWHEYGATQLWKAMHKIKDKYNLVIRGHIYSRATLLYKGISKWHFMCDLNRAWRMHRDMEFMRDVAMWRPPEGGPNQEKPFNHEHCRIDYC